MSKLSFPVKAAILTAAGVADWGVVDDLDWAMNAMGFTPEDTESDPYLNATVTMALPWIRVYLLSKDYAFLNYIVPMVGPMSRNAQKAIGGRISDWVFYFLGLADTPERQKKMRLSGSNVKRRGSRRRRQQQQRRRQTGRRARN